MHGDDIFSASPFVDSESLRTCQSVVNRPGGLRLTTWNIGCTTQLQLTIGDFSRSKSDYARLNSDPKKGSEFRHIEAHHDTTSS